MEKKQTQGMPILVQMALGHDTQAMRAFLKMETAEQERFLTEARETNSVRAVQKMVESLTQK